MNKAVFLDRDGVMNKMIYEDSRNEYRPPVRKEELELYEGITEALIELQQNKYKLFLISNQPDHAKGRTAMKNLEDVHNELHRLLTDRKINFTDYYYCFHHPDGVVKEYSFDCKCRKPKNFFVEKAIGDYNIDNKASWFIGDRDKDVECGRISGMKTIRILSNYYEYKAAKDADYTASDLKDAVKIILRENNNIN